MDLQQLLGNVTPEIYQNLKRSVELGKWPDGRKLTREQKELCMEAMIYFENKSGMAESSRTGYLDRKKVEETSCNSSKDKKEEVQVVSVQGGSS